MRSLLLPLLLPLCAGLVTAQDTDLARLRALHGEYVKVRDDVNAKNRELSTAARAVTRGSDEYKDLVAKMNALRSQLAAPRKTFQAAFDAADWSKLDGKADGALLEDGLPTATRDLEHPKRALAACQLYLEHFADSRMAAGVRSSALPMALLACGQVGDATAALEKVIADSEGTAKARLLLTLGDIDAAGGDPARAAQRYAEAEELADERTMGYVTLRKELIGKPAPDIASEHWIGGKAKPLSGLQGKVVLVDFWATWCGPCRAVMPALNELYEQHHAQGLEVIGVTRFYASGYMAANPEQMRSGGERVQGLTAESFPEHVTQFRKNTGISYPFVIGEQSDFQNYFVRGIPTLAVVDRKGKIALITVGSGSEGLLKFAVQNLLAKK